MKANQTIISLKEIREFYKERCEDGKEKFSEKDFEAFIDYCERDFHQWLSDNFKYFHGKARKELYDSSKLWRQAPRK